MKVIKPSAEWLNRCDKETGYEFLRQIEYAGRLCYKSEEKITDVSAYKFVQMLIDKKHEAMLEHAPDIMMKFICDRGVSHELVRHRLFSFAEVSTRYVSYKDKDIEFILPCWIKDEELLGYWDGQGLIIYDIDDPKRTWLNSCYHAEKTYKNLISRDWSPQQARSILPNSLKTEIIVKGNIREWRHFFKLRCAKDAHPQMQEVALIALHKLSNVIPILFDHII